MPKKELTRSLHLDKHDAGWADILYKQPKQLDQILLDQADSMPPWVYPLVLHFLMQLDMEEREAREHLLAIRKHLQDMESLLGRRVSFRVALLDYFHHVGEFLVNPRIIEHDLLEALITRTKEDPKTGCCNPDYFRQLVETELHRAKRYNQKCSLILLDIDDFKQVNDNHGHLFGDAVLQRFTNLLQESIRVEDCVGRFGGDEFSLLLPQTGRIGARCLAERVRFALDAAFENFCINDECAEITFSGGVATFPYDGSDYETLTNAADAGLYTAKDLGKNRISDRIEESDISNLVYAEKRQHRRFRLQEEKTVTFDTISTPVKVTGRVVNISTGGILLECVFALEEALSGQPLSIRFQDGLLQGLPTDKMKGRVVRVHTGNGHLRMAVSFENSIPEELWDGISRSVHLSPA